MSHIHPVTEICGSSPHSIDDAIQQAVASAQQKIRPLEYLRAIEIRGHFDSDGSTGHFPVGVKLGFCLDRPSGV